MLGKATGTFKIKGIFIALISICTCFKINLILQLKSGNVRLPSLIAILLLMSLITFPHFSLFHSLSSFLKVLQLLAYCFPAQQRMWVTYVLLYLVSKMCSQNLKCGAASLFCIVNFLKSFIHLAVRWHVVTMRLSQSTCENKKHLSASADA